MSQNEYKKIMFSIVATVAASLILSVSSIVTNHFNTKFQVQQNSKEIILKADKSYVDYKYNEAKQVAIEKEKRYNESISTLKENIDELKKNQQTTNSLLWEIRNKID